MASWQLGSGPNLPSRLGRWRAVQRRGLVHVREPSLDVPALQMIDEVVDVRDFVSLHKILKEQAIIHDILDVGSGLGSSVQEQVVVQEVPDVQVCVSSQMTGKGG